MLAQTGGAASETDVQFMRMALDEARAGDFPFGAVIVRDGTVIARGRNLGRTDRDPTAHGEMVAMQIPCRGRPGGAAWQHALHVGRTVCHVHGRDHLVPPRAGRLRRVDPQLATKIDQIMITSADLAARAPFAPISITGGVLANEAMALLPNA